MVCSLNRILTTLSVLESIGLKTCIYCNVVIKLCSCPTSLTPDRVVSQIVEKSIKRNKWITTVYTNMSKDEYILMKNKLGTGGTYSADKIELRGKVLDRVKKILLTRGYVIL
jgi:translation initiation factor 1 (eIF-1/SUI1)